MVALLAAALVLVLPMGISAQEGDDTQISGTIYGEGFTPRGIAVPPCRSDLLSAKTAGEITEIVSDDLDFSGYFRLVNPDLWQGMNLGGGPVDFVAWQAMQADYLVLSTLKEQGNEWILEGRLYDLKAQEMVTGKRIKGPKNNVRALAHNLSSVILDYLWGAGSFPTSQVLFTSQVGDTQDIYICDYDGKKLLRLTALGILNVTPDVNSGGDRIAFTSILKDQQGLYLLDRAGKRVKLYGQGEGLNSSPRFSPDGKTVAFCTSKSGNPDIWSIGVDGSGLKRLTTSWAIDTAPSWSPDGSQIAFTSGRSGGPQIYIMDRDGSNVRRFSPPQSGRCDQPNWSPRGDRIAYATSVGGRFQVAVKDIVSGEVKVLTRGRADSEAPDWSPDGRYLAFASNRSGDFQIYIMRADGSGVKRISRQPECYQPCWF